MRKPLWPYWMVFQSNVMVFSYEEYGKISATNSLRQTTDPFLRLANTHNDRLAEQVHVCTIRPFCETIYAPCSWVSGRVWILERHVNLQASVVILVIAAIRRQSRPCRLRISSIQGFPFVGPVLSATRGLRAHTHPYKHIDGFPPKGSFAERSFHITVTANNITPLLQYILSRGVMYRWRVVKCGRGFPNPKLNTRLWPWSYQQRFWSSWTRPTRLAKDCGTVLPGINGVLFNPLCGYVMVMEMETAQDKQQFCLQCWKTKEIISSRTSTEILDTVFKKNLST
jgi:hypothetical protein